MPTPVGHSVTALVSISFLYPWSLSLITSPWLWFALISANAPDLDFLPGILIGNEGLYHRGPSHSVGAAVLYGLAAGLVVFVFTRSHWKARRAFSVGGGLVLLHLVLDIFVRDPGEPYGIELLWPLTDAYYYSSIYLFPNLSRHPFDLSVVGRAIPVVLTETAILVPFVFLAAHLRRRLGRKGEGLP